MKKTTAAPGRRVTLHTNPPRARELFMDFFKNSCEPKIRNNKVQWLRGRVAPGGGLFTLKETIGVSQLFSINTFDIFYLAYQGQVWTNTACVKP